MPECFELLSDRHSVGHEPRRLGQACNIDFCDVAAGRVQRAPKLLSVEYANHIFRRIAPQRDSRNTRSENILAAGVTRVPLWRNSPENVIGVLNAKELWRALHAAS